MFWEISFEAGTGSPAVMRNAGGARVLVKQCASVEEAEEYIATLNERFESAAKGQPFKGKKAPAFTKNNGTGDDDGDADDAPGAKKSDTDDDDDDAEKSASAGPYGDVTYADSKNKKYPVDTEEHARAAWSYINKPKNAAVYPLNGVTLSEVKSKIMAACKKFGIQISS